MAALGSQAPHCLKYAIFAGSSKNPKMDEKVLKYVIRAVRETRHEILVFDADSMEVPFVKKPVHYYSDRSQAPDWLREAEKKLETCDGFLYLSPEVNRSIPAALSNMIDYFGSNIYQAKPAGIITYSEEDVADIKSRRHLVDLLQACGAICLQNLHLSIITSADLVFDSEGQLNDAGMRSHVDKNISAYISQLDWYALAIKNQKELYDPLPH